MKMLFVIAICLTLASLFGCGGKKANNMHSPNSISTNSSSLLSTASSVGVSTASSFSATTQSSSVSISTPSSASSSYITSSAASSAPLANNQWVMGYYVGYLINSYPIAAIDWSGITHIIFSPMTVKSDRSLDLSFADENGTGLEDALALSQAAHAHGVKALLMLGGEGAGVNIAAAAEPAHLAQFVTDLIAAIDNLGYDGIDIDWEDSINFNDLVALAKALRAARPEIILSYPAYPYNRNYYPIDDIYMVELAESLDRFNVQTYIPAAAVAGIGLGWDSWLVAPLSGATTNTPVSIEDSLDHFASVGIPREKLGMGTAFYAVCYTNGITAPHQNADNSTIVGGDNVYPLSAFYAPGNTFAKSTAGEQQRHAAAAEPYLSFATPINDAYCGAPTQYISYEDETSIIAKGAFSKANGYGGIIIWTIQEGWLPPNATGGRAPNALMQALKEGFIDP